MFELKLLESKDFQERINVLRKTMECIGDIVDDAELKVTEKGFQIQVMDTMHVALVDIFLSSDMFDKFRADRNITLGLKMKEFLKIFKNVKLDEISEFAMSCNDDAQLLNINIESADYSLQFEFKLFQFEIENYGYNQFEYSANVEMGPNDFARIPKTVGAFAEHIAIHALKDEINFRAKGDLIDSNMTLKTLNTGNSNIKIDVKESVKKEVAMRYINYIAKVISLAEECKICMGEDTPVYFELLMKNGYLKYFIAPKVEN